VLAAKSLGGKAWEKAGRIWYDAMLQLSRTSDFKDCARITAQIAADRFGPAEKKSITAAWKQVGIK
jgi:Zn-dependent metalloprotease